MQSPEVLFLTDSHAHINAPEFAGDLDDILRRMRQARVAACTVIGCDFGEEDRVCAICRDKGTADLHLYGAWALHPEYENRPPITPDEIARICSAKEIFAVGETGLDYHWCKGDLTWQKERFRAHIAAAKMLGKPLIVHAREAESDAVDILAREKAGDVGFVLHCYGGDKDTALRCIDAGGMVSFTGVITFKNATALQEVAAALPLTSLMVETDCPYMTPVPFRGKRNEPAYVALVAQKLAELQGVDAAEVARVTTENFKRFLHIQF